MSRADDLERLLDEAREASPAERLPTYRDAIAAFGEEAIEPLATWLEEPALAAFAIRTLGRIAATHPDAGEAVVAALVAADRSAMPDHIARALDAALDQLGLSPTRRAAARARDAGPRAMSARPILNPGVDGRGYWAMRTSPWERPYIWAEAQRGRLRQGWGWAAEQKSCRWNGSPRISIGAGRTCRMVCARSSGSRRGSTASRATAVTSSASSAARRLTDDNAPGRRVPVV